MIDIVLYFLMPQMKPFPLLLPGFYIICSSAIRFVLLLSFFLKHSHCKLQGVSKLRLLNFLAAYYALINCHMFLNCPVHADAYN